MERRAKPARLAGGAADRDPGLAARVGATIADVTFESLTLATLPVVEPWFDDPETQRWLGNREWPRRLIGLAAEAPTWDDVSARHALLARVEGEVVALVDLEVYVDGTAGFAFVVAPRRRRRGLCTRVLSSLLARPELSHVGVLRAGVEPENRASAACLRCAGFSQTSPANEEGVVYSARRV